MKIIKASRICRNLFQFSQGNVLLLVSLGVMTMFTAVGAAVDMARLQTLQTRLVSALDSAGLAAGATESQYTSANMPNDCQGYTSWPACQAQRYFNANLPQGFLSSYNYSAAPPYTNPIVVTTLIGGVDAGCPTARTLCLSAKAIQQTTFMRMLGIPTMTAAANITIALPQYGSGLELAIIVDNSGSMANAVDGGSVSASDPSKMQAVMCALGGTTLSNYIQATYGSSSSNYADCGSNSNLASTGLLDTLYGPSSAPNPNVFVGLIPVSQAVNIGINTTTNSDGYPKLTSAKYSVMDSSCTDMNFGPILNSSVTKTITGATTTSSFKCTVAPDGTAPIAPNGSVVTGCDPTGWAKTCETIMCIYPDSSHGINTTTGGKCSGSGSATNYNGYTLPSTQKLNFGLQNWGGCVMERSVTAPSSTDTGLTLDESEDPPSSASTVFQPYRVSLRSENTADFASLSAPNVSAPLPAGNQTTNPGTYTKNTQCENTAPYLEEYECPTGGISPTPVTDGDSISYNTNHSGIHNYRVDEANWIDIGAIDYTYAGGSDLDLDPTSAGEIVADWNNSRTHAYMLDGTTASQTTTFKYYDSYNPINDPYYNNIGGPNAGCGLASVMPLSASQTNVEAAIAQMEAGGNTALPTGVSWGWRVLSPYWGPEMGGTDIWKITDQFTDSAQAKHSLPLPYFTYTPSTKKAAIILTDGMNDWGGFSAYGWSNDNKLASTPATASPPGNTSDVSTGQLYSEGQMDAHMIATCNGMRKNGITLYTIGFGQPLATVPGGPATTCPTPEASGAPSSINPQGQNERNGNCIDLALLSACAGPGYTSSNQSALDNSQSACSATGPYCFIAPDNQTLKTVISLIAKQLTVLHVSQ